jgi:hypothetical protein
MIDEEFCEIYTHSYLVRNDLLNSTNKILRTLQIYNINDEWFQRVLWVYNLALPLRRVNNCVIIKKSTFSIIIVFKATQLESDFFS